MHEGGDAFRILQVLLKAFRRLEVNKGPKVKASSCYYVSNESKMITGLGEIISNET